MSSNKPTILKEILARKAEEVELLLQQHSLSSLENLAAKSTATRNFGAAITDTIAQGAPAVIAEIKKASPSKGIIRQDFNPAEIARQYETSGATCLSVLTDEKYFLGCNNYLLQAREACTLPVIRKDFIIDRAQIAEARAIGADCILLIAAAMEEKTLFALNQYALDLGLDVLIEVHNKQELEVALQTDNKLIGINNRDLHQFETSLNTTFNLLEFIDQESRTVITESGINSRADVAQMRSHQVNAFLVGEALMRQQHPGQALSDLFFAPEQ